MNDFAADLLLALDPARTAAQAGITLDPWQSDFVASDASQTAMLIPRQHGKTEAASIKALSVARTEPDSLILIISPAQRLSNEFIRRSKASYSRIENAPKLVGDSITKMELENKSRVLALPGDNDGDTLRGLANVRLAIIDEAARCSDELIAAVRPMLATNNRAQLVMLSTPAGRRGVFFETWHRDDPQWKKIHVPLGSCSRISQAFLDQERKNLGETKFREEYGCEFLDNEMQAFNGGIIDAAFTDRIKPLWN